MGFVLMWPNITTGVNVLFEDILALTKGGHIVSSKRVNWTEKNVVVIGNVQKQMTCDVRFYYYHVNSIHRSHMKNQ